MPEKRRKFDAEFRERVRLVHETGRALVDADNVSPARIRAVLGALAAVPGPIALVASGREAALRRLPWPPGAQLLPHSGWQAADVALAAAYRPDELPLVLVTGDGDFALLAARHPGPVLVVSGAPSGRLRDHATVIDPAIVGAAPITAWLRAHGLLSRRAARD